MSAVAASTQVDMIFRPALRFLTGPFPPVFFAARFLAAVIRPPLLFFAILNHLLWPLPSGVAGPDPSMVIPSEDFCRDENLRRRKVSSDDGREDSLQRRSSGGLGSRGISTPRHRRRGWDHELRRWWSGKRGSNPRLPPWQGGALPLSYSRAPGVRGVRDRRIPRLGARRIAEPSERVKPGRACPRSPRNVRRPGRSYRRTSFLQSNPRKGGVRCSSRRKKPPCRCGCGKPSGAMPWKSCGG